MNSAQKTRIGNHAEDERGAVLVLAALLLVGIFGLLGVVVDGGRLRVTKQQMDAGAESAALEGLRFKNVDSDAQRRNRAQTALARQWDDDLLLGADALGLGAGTLPIVQNATPLGGRIVVPIDPAARVWKPANVIQSNLQNAAHGDFVAGTHVPLPLGAPAPAGEDDAFVRADFVPAAAGSSSAALQSEPSFLVRLRRADARLPLDRQPGESSAGPPFEWLWARGSAWQEPGAADLNQSRADGLTVRATSIATAERALVVSAVPALGVLIAPIALRVDPGALWTTTLAGQTLSLRLADDGTLSDPANGGEEQGLRAAATPNVVYADLIPLSGAPLTISSGPVIVPVYAAADGRQRVVVGFTRAVITVVGDDLSIARSPGGVLPTGSSSVSPVALDARLALSQSPSFRALHESFIEPVLAPALRR